MSIQQSRSKKIRADNAGERLAHTVFLGEIYAIIGEKPFGSADVRAILMAAYCDPVKTADRLRLMQSVPPRIYDFLVSPTRGRLLSSVVAFFIHEYAGVPFPWGTTTRRLVIDRMHTGGRARWSFRCLPEKPCCAPAAEDDICCSIGRRLREARLKMHFSAKKTAATAGVSHKMLLRYERHEVVPGVINLSKICRALNVSSDWVLGL